MLKFGLEVEFFGLAIVSGKDVIVSAKEYGLPHDEYPILIEARGLPSCDVFQAVGSVDAEIKKIVALMKNKGVQPLFVNWFKRNPQTDKLHDSILRAGLTKTIAYQNLDNKSVSKMNKNHISAGLHISFTNERVFNYTNKDNNNLSIKYNEIFDYVQIFRRIEKEFGDEIRVQKRTPGFYEIKGDGRVEYRSLPATAILLPDFSARLDKAIRG